MAADWPLLILLPSLLLTLLPIVSYGLQKQRKLLIYGGSGRNRTGVDGFAIRCITTLPPSLVEKR